MAPAVQVGPELAGTPVMHGCRPLVARR